MTTNDLVTETLKMEGDRFKLLKKIDRCHSIYDYPFLKQDLEHMEIKLTMYQNTIKAMRDLSKIKRKMSK